MICILYNPLANNSKGEQDARNWAKENGVEGKFVSLLETQDMIGFLNGLDPDDEVILTGGDGTLNRFARSRYLSIMSSAEAGMTFFVTTRSM